jgi:hypothetical protein
VASHAAIGGAASSAAKVRDARNRDQSDGEAVINAV